MPIYYSIKCVFVLDFRGQNVHLRSQKLCLRNDSVWLNFHDNKNCVSWPQNRFY